MTKTLKTPCYFAGLHQVHVTVNESHEARCHVLGCTN